MANNLFDDFPSVSAKEWKLKIQEELRGADYNDLLVWSTSEGIDVKPFYHPDDLKGKSPIRIEIPSQWNVGLRVDGTAEDLAGELKASIDKGAERLILDLTDADNLSSLFSKKSVIPIYTKFHPVLLDDHIKYLDWLGSVPGSYMSIDLLGHLASTGNWYRNKKEDHKILETLLEHPAATFGADLSLYLDAGANSVQQLAYGMAQAVEYLDHLEDRSEDLKGKPFIFWVGLGGNYFFEIAKLRALRLLWDLIIPNFKADMSCHIVAFPGRRNKTIYDYNVNMLRTTTECMSGVLGGADTVYNIPYDSVYHDRNDFAERIALNQLLLLKHESFFDLVNNPADGAYYLEEITRQLSGKALELLKETEKGGGYLKALESHTLQKKIRENRERQQKDFDNSNTVLIGSNRYSLASEKMRDNLDFDPFGKTKGRKTILEPVIPRRLAQNLEKERLENE